MAEASIALRLEDNMSAAIVGIRNAVTPFRRDLGLLQQELNVMSATRVNFQVDLRQARQELNETQRAFESLGESATEAERDAARTNMEAAAARYDNIGAQLRAVSRQASQTERDMLSATDAITRADNRASRASDNSGGMLAGLGRAGLIQMGGEAASQWANVLVSSSFGADAGTYFGGTLGGAASGAALGLGIGGIPGAAIGGLVGGAVGLAGAGAQVYEKKNDAFRGFVQEQTEGQLGSMRSDVSEGSAIAAKREGDAISFNTLLGEGRGDAYLTDMRAMAAKTPMEYDDLAGMSRALATGFKDDTDRMLRLMSGVGNAGSAVGIDASGMTEMAKAMSRMQSSGKAGLENLNMFQERGVDAIGMLSEHFGKSKGEIYDMISAGKIGGLEAVDAIEAGLDNMYAGAMEKQSATFSGLSSTLADAQAEMKNAYGEGFNATRAVGLQEEIDYLGGVSGEQQQAANAAMGAFVASLENEKERLMRESIDSVLASEEYMTAMASGSSEGAATAGRLLMEAKSKAMMEYNASEGAQLMVQMELTLASSIRENAESNAAYYNAGLRKGEQYSKGFSVAVSTNTRAYMETGGTVGGDATPSKDGKSNAFGLSRVPYDNYAAMLHEGERVLTASEARNYNNNTNNSVTVNLGGSYTVREEADISRIAMELADLIELARMGGA